MRPGSDALITVIVPAYNAEATLAETLASISRQRHRALEILIIDDGSTDATPAIAARFCETDPRARLLTKPNGGVASARNLGLLHARAEYVAPIDADDLWHPDHLAGLVAHVQRSPEPLGFVCARSRHIDRASRVLGSAPPGRLRNNGVDALLVYNFVGNGSAMMMKRSAALEAGGYEERLRAAGAEGCEDYLLQLRIADRHPVAVVDAFTVGYRLLSNSMSSNIRQMIESEKLALALFFSTRQGGVLALKRKRAGHARALLRDSLLRGKRSAAAIQLLRAFIFDFHGTFGALFRHALFLAFRRGDQSGSSCPPFVAVGPQDILDTALDRARRLTSLPRHWRGPAGNLPCPPAITQPGR